MSEGVQEPLKKKRILQPKANKLSSGRWRKTII